MVIIGRLNKIALFVKKCQSRTKTKIRVLHIVIFSQYRYFVIFSQSYYVISLFRHIFPKLFRHIAISSYFPKVLSLLLTYLLGLAAKFLRLATMVNLEMALCADKHKSAMVAESINMSCS